MQQLSDITYWSKSLTDRPAVKRLLAHQFWRKLFATVGPEYILRETEGCVFHCYLKDGSGPSRYLIKYSEYEPFVTRVIKANLSATGSVLDIGANFGYYSIVCSKLTSGTIYSFEPEPSVYRLFKLNQKANQCSTIKDYHLAASDKPGELHFYVNRFNLGDHRCYEFDNNISHSLSVKADTVDNVLRNETGAGQLDLIKIDVQGFELSVVNGMTEILERNPGVKIITEYEPESLQQAGADPVRYLQFFLERGFEAHLLDESREEVRPVGLDNLLGIKHVNLLFKKPG